MEEHTKSAKKIAVGVNKMPENTYQKPKVQNPRIPKSRNQAEIKGCMLKIPVRKPE